MQVVARCAMSTTMGACFGGCTGLLVMLIYTKITTGHAMWDLTVSTNGALTGMVVSNPIQPLSPVQLVMLVDTRITTGHAMWYLTRSTNSALTGMVVSSPLCPFHHI